jgi:transcription elongation GreA/GreB family factor
VENTIKVTQSGYSKLLLRKQVLIKNLKETQSKKGAAATDGGDGWHDNFTFEQLCQQETMDNQRISDISAKINKAELIDDNPIDNEFLQIGHIGIFELDNKEERTYEIVGFGESDLKATPPKVEYLAPIVRKFIGREVETSAKIEIGGKLRRVTLIDILQKGG